MDFLFSLLGAAIATEIITEFIVSPASLLNKLLFLRVPKEVRKAPGVIMNSPFTVMCAWCLSFWIAQAATFVVFFHSYQILTCFGFGWITWRLSNFVHDFFGFIYRKKKFTGSMILSGRGN